MDESRPIAPGNRKTPHPRSRDLVIREPSYDTPIHSQSPSPSPGHVLSPTVDPSTDASSIPSTFENGKNSYFTCKCHLCIFFN